MAPSCPASKPVAMPPASSAAQPSHFQRNTASPDSVCTVPLHSSPPTLNNRLTVALDLDETLVHCRLAGDSTKQQAMSRALEQSEFRLETSEEQLVHVNLRPGLKKFLREASVRFNLHAFTASEHFYARPLLRVLDASKKFFKSCHWRSDCLAVDGGHFVKDLCTLPGETNLERTVLVDNNPISFLPQPRNGIPIVSYYDDPGDSALSILMDYLCKLEPLADVRPRLHQTFQIEPALEQYKRMRTAGAPSS